MWTAFMGCKRWGVIFWLCNGWFVSIVKCQVTIYYKEENTKYRTSCGILYHYGCKEKCGWLEET